jgi:pyruvate-ferredoxin/flavodoxin oxidoreductase
MGSQPRQTLRALLEAEAYDGPSLVIAYSHCIAHGYDMRQGLRQQGLAVNSGHWVLCRYNPDLAAEGKNPLQLDSKAPSIPLHAYANNEIRYKVLNRSNPEEARRLMKAGQQAIQARWKLYEEMAAEPVAEEVERKGG